MSISIYAGLWPWENINKLEPLPVNPIERIQDFNYIKGPYDRFPIPKGYKYCFTPSYPNVVLEITTGYSVVKVENFNRISNLFEGFLSPKNRYSDHCGKKLSVEMVKLLNFKLLTEEPLAAKWAINFLYPKENSIDHIEISDLSKKHYER